jgi:hypothetical protein
MDMGIDPRAVLPPQMARLVAENDAQEARQAQLAEYEAIDQAAIRAAMLRHQEHVQEATTGYTAGEWTAAQQARVDALAERGWDPAAAPGSPGRPAILVAGQDVSSGRPVAEAARSGQAAEEDRLLEAHRRGRAEWSSPAIIRQRRLSLEAEIRRHQPPATSAAGGRRVDDWPADPAPAIGPVRVRRGQPPPQRLEVPPLAAPEFAPWLPADW